MAGEKPSSGSYETFDSGDGPTVPASAKSDFAHNDSKEAIASGKDVEHGAVPEVPQK